jgi:tRNA G18 (ribose-2'-O)-methylase SpoU
MTKTSRSTEKYISHEIKTNISDIITYFKSLDHFIIALEITENSEAITTFQLQTKQPIVLIIGNENFGITESILEQCDAIVHINMYGQNSSMNVVQATSIALYELTKQYNN